MLRLLPAAHALAWAAAAAGSLSAQHGDAASDYSPKLQPASDAAQQAIAGFQPAAGLAVTLIAAEPDLANPVAFDLGDDGRIYVVETHRINDGVIDMRGHRRWVLEDLACQTVEDRVAEIHEHFAGQLDRWRMHHERLRCLIDEDGDLVTDRSTVFADGFNTLADGIAAGVLAHGDKVWFTNIPSLWEFTDADRDGVAEARRDLHGPGYGVHFSLIGHDLHGLRIGPDRRLYFSIGDRGFHIEHEGNTFAHPHEGAVLRCELDGSKLEVVHRGLRNPQELAFDDFGDLFTGDNNSDGGDKARWVHVIEGADSGWRIGFQWLGDRGAWNRERMWLPRDEHPHPELQPRYVLPPLENVANGPSGLTHHPGTGFDPRYRGAFLLCEFRGSPSGSGILALRNERVGASHRLAKVEQVLWKVLATDVEFGPDGGMYVLDWVRGWGKTGRGRVYRVAPPGLATDALAAEVRGLLRDGMAGRDVAKLVRLLDHADRRVRQAAQFELVDREAADALGSRLAQTDGLQSGRLHALWGLGILARHDAEQAPSLRPFVKDDDAEIRGQAIRLLGEADDRMSLAAAIALLDDAEPRVRFFAAQALGRIGDASCTAPLFELLRRTDQQDLVLHQAGVTALHRLAAAAACHQRRGDPSRSVRLAAAVVLRRLHDPRLAEFLADSDPLVQLEAARGIQDEPILEALPALAAKLDDLPAFEHDMGQRAFVDRELGAHRLLGGVKNLRALLAFAADDARTERARREALDIVAEWREPRPQNRVHGNVLGHLPAQRSALLFRAALQADLPAVLSSCRGDLARLACKIAASAPRSELGDALATLVLDAEREPATRAEALRAFGKHADAATQRRIAAGIGPDDPVELRRGAVAILAELDPDAAVPNLRSLAVDGAVADARNAVQTLQALQTDAADQALAALVQDLGSLHEQVQLDALAAARTRKVADSWDAVATASGNPLAAWLPARHGGDAKTGETLFREHVSAACTRCHQYQGVGGVTGPALDDLGDRRDRDYLLRALITPGADIAEGYEQVTLSLRDGSKVTGTSRGREDGVEILLDADGNELRVTLAEVTGRESSGSAMPPMATLLQPLEVRDLIEFLATRRADKNK